MIDDPENMIKARIAETIIEEMLKDEEKLKEVSSDSFIQS